MADLDDIKVDGTLSVSTCCSSSRSATRTRIPSDASSCSSVMSSTTTTHLPGRLGDPDMKPSEDPRLHPVVLKVAQATGTDGLKGEDLPRGASFEDCLMHFMEMDKMMHQAHAGFCEKHPPIEGVETSVEVITGVDGNDIALYICKPTAVSGAIPCVLHIHGGAMCVMSAAMDGYQYFRRALASLGVIVISVEFRNSGGLLGPHPFPAGLNDCSSALQWCHDHQEELGYSKLLVQGESGGANLALATVLKAKRDGKIEQVQGVFASCPYIHGDYDTPDPMMVSSIENDAYQLNTKSSWATSFLYDPEGQHKSNPLAWPVHAQEEDLQGLPPMMVAVNELDPLRDEGLVFFRKAVKAGVNAISITRNGMMHCSEMHVLHEVPEITWTAFREIRNFAQML